MGIETTIISLYMAFNTVSWRNVSGFEWFTLGIGIEARHHSDLVGAVGAFRNSIGRFSMYGVMGGKVPLTSSVYVGAFGGFATNYRYGAGMLGGLSLRRGSWRFVFLPGALVSDWPNVLYLIFLKEI
jgi:hypothetical protein